MNEQDIFLTALDCESAQDLNAYLDEACGVNSALRQRIEALLSRHAEASQFLEHPALEIAATQLESEGGSLPETMGHTTFSDWELRDLGFLEPSDNPESLGALGQYEMLEVVGRGGMGLVFKARDRKLDRIVAVKVLAPEIAAIPAAHKRFLREARTAGSISHDHIVTIHAVEAGLCPYLVMEYIDGKSLQQKIDEEGQLALKEVLRIARQIAAGLAAAHSQGLIHRDIKPSNILLQNGIERVQITDFGLARAAADVDITRTGEIAGTPQYMSPEQVQSQPLDARSDLFSLGSVMYAMCAGRSPFRADTGYASLRRVCEDEPRPLHEISPETPEWLIAIIAKLLMKNPADRFQSAQEVADKLAQHLAHLQDPQAAAFAVATKPVQKPTPNRQHRWLIPLLVLIGLIGIVGMTEATGLTKFSGSVIRLVTGEGTLVIEVDDPSIEISLDGEELRITGAGFKELKLRPGQYQFQATKDGKPIEQKLVSITRGNREVVRITREGIGTAESSKVQSIVDATGAFVVQGGKGIAERKLDTLAEAVLIAGDGDTIEIRGNGPFITQPISIDKRALTIRAGTGFWPVLKADPAEPGNILLQSNSLLVLEGLDLQWVEAMPFDPANPRYPRLVVSSGPTARLYAVNCRFLMNRREGPHQMTCIGVWDAASCHLRNCQLLGGGHGSLSSFLDIITGIPNTTVVVDNCLMIGHGTGFNGTHAEPTKVVLNQNTFLGPYFVDFYLSNKIDLPGREKNSRPFQIVSSANIFGGQMMFRQSQMFLEKEEILSAKDTERLLTQLVGWQENRNLYFSPEDSALLELNAEIKPGPATTLSPTVPITTLLAWKNFWGMKELDSQRGQAKFHGGNLVAKAKSTPELILPEDFRLLPDSAGYKAGKDGKDLGADVDLVGPGPAYERWKKTPEYQEWRNLTGQLKQSATATTEKQAFVLLNRQGNEVRTFDALVDAVIRASDGDTIEIRGNGPFETAPIDLEQKVLTIRAGEGYRPHLRHHPTDPNSIEPLLKAHRALALEGLILERGPNPGVMPWLDHSAVVKVYGGPVHIANCRLVGHRSHTVLYLYRISEGVFTNCEILNADGWCGIGAAALISSRLLLENNLIVSQCGLGVAFVWKEDFDALQQAVIFLRQNSICAGIPFYHINNALLGPAQFAETTKPRLRLEATGNVLASKFAFRFPVLDKSITLNNAVPLLPKLMSFQDEDNLYAVPGNAFLELHRDGGNNPFQTIDGLQEWHELWGIAESGSQLGTPRFAGGDVVAKSMADPVNVSPTDFRLLSDSPGYKSGKDGKDLGADVDLVGPGLAYERYKKTPEYEQWLKDTGRGNLSE